MRARDVLHRGLAAIAVTLAVAGFSGCGRSEGPCSRPSREDLPEPGVLVGAAEWREAGIRAARKYLDDAIRPTLSYFQQEPLGNANIEAATRRLSASMYREDRTPLSLCGSYGFDAGGIPYLNVIVLNEHRETSAIWLFVHCEATSLTVRIALPLRTKDAEIVLPQFLNIQHVSWDEFRKDSEEDSDHVVQVNVTDDSFVRLPPFHGCTVVAGAEDRLNGLGNFVPLTERDWPR